MKKQLLAIAIVLAVTFSLCKAQTPFLFGMTNYGGALGEGTIFKSTLAAK